MSPANAQVSGSNSQERVGYECKDISITDEVVRGKSSLTVGIQSTEKGTLEAKP